MSRVRTSIYVLLGILLPVAALTANYAMFGGTGHDMLYLVGALFLLPRQAYLYVTIGSGVVTLLLWMVFFQAHAKRYNGFIGGILLFNALFYLVFGIAAIYRLWFIPVWLPPFCAVPILFLSGVQALKIARSVMHDWQVAVTAVAGSIFVVMLSLLIVRQPWGLIKYLQNPQGANLSGMDLSHIYLDGCSGVSFEQANLSYADLSYARLVNCDLNMQAANLRGANLSHAVLSIVDLAGADLRGGNLSHAVLKFVDLSAADLRGANLNNAALFQVDLTYADLQGASLGFYAGGRILMGNTNLCGADLRDIKTISGVYGWERAVYDSATLWPEDFDPAKAGAVLLVNQNTTDSDLATAILGKWQYLPSLSDQRPGDGVWNYLQFREKGMVDWSYDYDGKTFTGTDAYRIQYSGKIDKYHKKYPIIHMWSTKLMATRSSTLVGVTVASDSRILTREGKVLKFSDPEGYECVFKRDMEETMQ